MKQKNPLGSRSPSATNAFASKEDHFKDIKETLNILKDSEKLTDLRFVCAFEDSFRTVTAHAAVVAPHSSMLRELILVAKMEQPGQPTCITLDNVDPILVEKILQYLYLGEVQMDLGSKPMIAKVCELLNIKIALEDPLSSESSESDSEEPPRKVPTPTPSINIVAAAAVKSPSPRNSPEPPDVKPPSPPPIVTNTTESSSRDSKHMKKPKMGPKGKMAQRVSKVMNGDEGKETQATTAVPREKSPKPNGMDGAVAAEVQKETPVGKINDPLFVGSSTSSSVTSNKQCSSAAAPQKRRMAEPDRKVETKDSKKMRQEESSSEVDSDAVAKRKSEVPPSLPPPPPPPTAKEPKKKAVFDGAADKEGGGTKKTAVESSPQPQKKPRPGPASRTNKPKSTPTAVTPEPKKKKQEADIAAATDGIFATEGIQICSQCSAIFVTSNALQEHVASKHKPGGGGSDRKVSTESQRQKNRSDSESSDSPAKRPALKKKPASKIKEERRKSARSTSSSSSSGDERPSPPRKKNMTPKVKLVSTKSSPVATVIKSEGTTPKAVRRHSSAGKDSPAAAVIGCTHCDDAFPNTGNYKNHLVNHFKEQLLRDLPSSKPFECPTCHALSRDKITLLRHYAYTHKAILDYCTQADMAGRSLHGGNCGNGSSSSTPKPGRGRPATKKQMLAESLLSSSSSSSRSRSSSLSSDGGKGTKEKEASRPPSAAAAAAADDSKVTPPVKFSDESDDGCSAAVNAVMGLDSLFGKEEEEIASTKKEGVEDQPVVNSADGEANGVA